MEEQTKELTKPEKAPVMVPFEENKGLVPTDLDGLWRVSTMITSANMAVKGDTPAAVATKIQFGCEIGLSIMASVQNISVINGRPAVWGDAPLGIVEASGVMEDFFEEEIGTYPNDDYGWKCKVKRKNRPEIFRVFTVADAKLAGLWCRDGNATAEQKYTPWYKYPRRMLQMRARSWALRDVFPDKLKGIAIGEEHLGTTEPGPNIVIEDVDRLKGADPEKVYAAEKFEKDEEPDEKKAEEPEHPADQELNEATQASIDEAMKAENTEPQEAEETPDNPFNNPDNYKMFKRGKDGLSTFFYDNRNHWPEAELKAQNSFAMKWRQVYFEEERGCVPDYPEELAEYFRLKPDEEPEATTEVTDDHRQDVINNIKASFDEKTIFQAKVAMEIPTGADVWPPSLEGVSRLFDMCVKVRDEKIK